MIKRKLLLSLIVIMGTVLVSMFSLSIVQTVMSMRDRPDAATTRTISNKEEMISFINDAKTNSFSGVTVKLTADIDMKEYTTLPIGASGSDFTYSGRIAFKGTFDGCGHSISNLVIKVDDVTLGTTTCYIGFFAELDGSVLNTIFQGITVQDYDAEFVDFSIGVICGTIADGVISDCAILNCIYADYNADVWAMNVVRIAPVCGMAYYSYAYNIKNIYIDGFTISNMYNDDDYVTVTTAHKIGPSYMIYENGSTFTTPSMSSIATNSCVIIKCDINSEMVKIDSRYYDETVIYSGISTNKIVDASEEYLTGIDLCEPLGDQVSSWGGSTGTPWYYVNKYNSGYPYLRSFITGWETHTFALDPSAEKLGSLCTDSDFVATNDDGSMSIVVPIDLHTPADDSRYDLQYVLFGIDSNGKYFGVEATAYDENMHGQWKIESAAGGYKYTATFLGEVKYVTFKNFADPSGYDPYVYVVIENLDLGTREEIPYYEEKSRMFQIPYGSRITANNGTYRFTDVNNYDYEVSYAVPYVVDHFRGDNLPCDDPVNNNASSIVVIRDGEIIPYTYECGAFIMADDVGQAYDHVARYVYNSGQWIWDGELGYQEWDDIYINRIGTWHNIEIKCEIKNKEIIYSCVYYGGMREDYLVKYTWDDKCSMRSTGLDNWTYESLKVDSPADFNYYISPTFVLIDHVYLTFAVGKAQDGDRYYDITPKNERQNPITYSYEVNRGTYVYPSIERDSSGNIINIQFGFNYTDELDGYFTDIVRYNDQDVIFEDYYYYGLTMAIDSYGVKCLVVTDNCSIGVKCRYEDAVRITFKPIENAYLYRYYENSAFGWMSYEDENAGTWTDDNRSVYDMYKYERSDYSIDIRLEDGDNLDLSINQINQGVYTYIASWGSSRYLMLVDYKPVYKTATIYDHGYTNKTEDFVVQPSVTDPIELIFDSINAEYSDYVIRTDTLNSYFCDVEEGGRWYESDICLDVTNRDSNGNALQRTQIWSESFKLNVYDYGYAVNYQKDVDKVYSSYFLEEGMYETDHQLYNKGALYMSTTDSELIYKYVVFSICEQSEGYDYWYINEYTIRYSVKEECLDFVCISPLYLTDDTGSEFTDGHNGIFCDMTISVDVKLKDRIIFTDPTGEQGVSVKVYVSDADYEWAELSGDSGIAQYYPSWSFSNGQAIYTSASYDYSWTAYTWDRNINVELGKNEYMIVVDYAFYVVYDLSGIDSKWMLSWTSSSLSTGADDGDEYLEFEPDSWFSSLGPNTYIHTKITLRNYNVSNK